MTTAHRYYVYLVTNIIDGTQYVGKSVDPNYRWGAHKSHAKNERLRTTHFLKAIHVHGVENFVLSIHSEHSTEAEAYAIERQTTDELKLKGVKLYNEQSGGRGGHSNPSPDLRLKLSISRTGERHPLWGKPGTRLGAKNSVTQLTKFRATVRNKQYGKLGTTPSEETRALWSSQRKGRKFHGKPKLTSEEKLRIKSLFANGAGNTASEIAQMLNRSVSIVQRVIRAFFMNP